MNQTGSREVRLQMGSSELQSDERNEFLENIDLQAGEMFSHIPDVQQE